MESPATNCQSHPSPQPCHSWVHRHHQHQHPSPQTGHSSLPHHHHHFFHVSPHCPVHSYLLHSNTHSPACPFSTGHPFSQNPESFSSVPALPNALNFRLSESKETEAHAQVMQEQNEDLELEGEEDPVFVLTDEWREFFAKSEAKRRLAKKQAKKMAKK